MTVSKIGSLLFPFSFKGLLKKLLPSVYPDPETKYHAVFQGSLKNNMLVMKKSPVTRGLSDKNQFPSTMVRVLKEVFTRCQTAKVQTVTWGVRSKE